MADETKDPLRAALEGLRYPAEPGEPDRYCDHAAEPCNKCERVRAALSAPAPEPQGWEEILDRCRKAVIVLRDILRNAGLAGVDVADQLLADISAMTPEMAGRALRAVRAPISGGPVVPESDDEWEERCRRVEAHANRQMRRAEAAEATLRRLVERLDEIHESDAYLRVWQIAQIHQGPYQGPTYIAELDAARALAASTGKEPTHE